MKLHIAPSYEHLRPQLERLPELFAAEAGEVLHAGRNTIRAIETEGLRLAAKRFKRPNAFNSLVYAYLRKSKAQRAYEHAQRLRAIGIDSPEPIAWCEIRRNGVIADTYFVARYTSLHPLLDAIERYPADDSRAVLESPPLRPTSTNSAWNTRISTAPTRSTPATPQRRTTGSS